MSDFRGINYKPELEKRNRWLSTIQDEFVDDTILNIAKYIHIEKNESRNSYDIQKNGKLRISSKHAINLNENDLFFGMLGEAVVAWKYGLGAYWLKEQKKQIEMIKKFGIFDITDIGNTQIRTVCYREKLVSIIIRPKDFISKSGQPIIGCVYYPKKQSIKICGWTTLDQIKKNNTQYGSFGGDGTPCYYEAPYKLFPMSTFDIRNFEI